MSTHLFRFPCRLIWESARTGVTWSSCGTSERYVPMLLGWVLVALGVEHFERLDHLLAGFVRLDDGINVSSIGGYVRIGEAFPKFFDLLLTHLLAIAGFFKLPLVNDIHGSFRAHDRDLRGWPGIVHVRANML